MASQAAPLDAVKAVAEEALTVTDCEAGAEPPAVALKVSEVGLTVIAPPVEAVTTSDIATVLVPERETMEMVPAYVPAARFCWFTLTVRVRLVVRLPVGEMVSQFLPPLWTEALAVKLVEREALTVSVWEGGREPFTVALKGSEVALRVRPEVWA
jgi:hypothetical protein